MSSDFLKLSESFKGGNPDDHRVNRVLLVGGVHDKQHVVSSNDAALLRHALLVFKRWGVPVSVNLAGFLEHKALLEKQSVKIINILPEQGGEDFLRSQETGDLLILGNVARDVPDEAIMRRGNAAYAAWHASLRAAFSSSPDHRDINCWRAQVDRSRANFVMVMNSDGFRLSELNNGNFVEISLPMGSTLKEREQGMLVRKDYLAEIETYLAILATHQEPSPLLDVAVRVEDNPSCRFSYRVSSGQLRSFDAP